MMTEFKIETVSQTARIVLDQCQTSQEENLIEYKNKLFRLITHIDTGYDNQSHGILEYFNGTDFIRIASFSHDEIAEQIGKRNYIKNRIATYPSLEDQLDMIFHDGIEVWRDKIQSVKDKYPKP